jgi:hypothetical protein
MFDTGAIHKNYSSKKVFDTLGIPLRTMESPRLRNFQMGMLSRCTEEPLYRLRCQWAGGVDVDVIDMDNMDVDVILGLPWHKENRAGQIGIP